MTELQPDSVHVGTSHLERDPVAVLKEVLRLMGFNVQVAAAMEPDHVVLNISGPDAQLLIGNKGETLDALQMLLNKIVSRDAAEHQPLQVDSDGYRQRRIEALIQLAQRLSEKAMRSGRIVALNPMSAHDRRVIHIALKNTPGVTTRSEGDGIYRRLLIVPMSEAQPAPLPEVQTDSELEGDFESEIDTEPGNQH